DETCNRRATLLKSVAMVMCCSPVCEKQALFALVQSYKENNMEENLIKKARASCVRFCCEDDTHADTHTHKRTHTRHTGTHTCINGGDTGHTHTHTHTHAGRPE